ncbi:hypothetical protein ABZ490_44685 [Streptomyces sp. NPDC005811]|uniref:hypothetical protein n=1 Tax=Streptomyces sp. NPDC005811 TaxID=3154565 RepID=UPI0033FA822B
MTDLGASADLSPQELLAVRGSYEAIAPEPAIVVDAIKATAKGTIGKFAERPRGEGKPLPGGWRIGVSPGMVKDEGTQCVLWGGGVRAQYKAPELNLARYITSRARSPTMTTGST